MATKIEMFDRVKKLVEELNPHLQEAVDICDDDEYAEAIDVTDDIYRAIESLETALADALANIDEKRYERWREGEES